MMGKTWKVSKGNSSKFVPDYRHAVETMNELERVGNFGRRVDNEITGSEGSCAPKRRRVSLNGENYDGFDVPIQVFPVSRMSQSEKRYLERRLKNELQQVRIVRQRLDSMGLNFPASPASDIRRRPALENLSRPLNEVTMLKGKKKPSQGRNGPHVKPTVASSTSIFMLMKQCETLLNRLMSHANAHVFNAPVDVVKLNIPDYFTIIKRPMDLGTIKSKLLSGQYSDPLGFAADVRLTFSNAITYNPPGNEVHIMARTISKFFEVRWKPIEKKFSVMVDFSLPSKPTSNIESETATSKSHIKKKVANVEQKVVKRVMSFEEKQKLSAELEELAEELPVSIIEFLKGNTNNSSESNEGEIEIDLDSLSDETLFTLRDLLNNYLSNKPKSEGKVEPCEIELQNESGFSNSSVQPFRGNDLADEDIDIGGNEAPISSFPPVEIEKDGGGENNKCSSSSSSSSDSGSSSSDSDTGSASRGDSDGIKNQEQTNEEKEPCSSWGNATPERQVSPGKNYRAALLRERFAETIMKAHVKTLEKDEKMDLDRLRVEREEFERKQKEDKACLLAEARAAKAAQRKVEAEAAAEAKRKRESEREAARQALQKMEKTIDINENTQFLEDLEMLRSAPEPSLLGVTSPDDDENGLGGFNFQASSNPLEQLGLYMKDDDEEEEGEPLRIKDVSDDSEEREVD